MGKIETPLEFLIRTGACKRGVNYVKEFNFKTFQALYLDCERVDWLCWILDKAWELENMAKIHHPWHHEHWGLFLDLCPFTSRFYHREGAQEAYLWFRGHDDYYQWDHKDTYGPSQPWKKYYTLEKFLFQLRQAGITDEGL